MGEDLRIKRKRSEETETQYMDVAEALFIAHGYEGTSIRAISSQAHMNLATVVYHWGTKRELFRALCHRRLGEIEKVRLTRLQALRDRPGGVSPDDLEAVLAALVEPPMASFAREEGRIVRQLYGRLATDPSPVVLGIAVEIFAEATGLFRELLRACLVGMDDQTFFWRYTMAVGAFVFTQSFCDGIAQATDIAIEQTDWGAEAEQLVAFMAAGLRGEPGGASPEKPKTA